tara:strand:- start:27 stop:503 length:477 start_codon:yes stop_codon:yes gene_type:complete
MIDLVIYAPTKDDLRSFAVARGLLETVVEEEVTSYVKAKDFDYCWWAGSGQFIVSKGTYDTEGAEVTPPTFAPGVVALLRVGATGDEIDPGATENPEQWHRSQVAKWVKDNGTPGSFFGGAIPYYDVAGVRLMRPSDVKAWLSSEGLPGHEWAGGSTY